MNHRSIVRRAPVGLLASAISASVLLTPAVGRAYGPVGHQRLTDLAWQTMQATRHFGQIQFEEEVPPSLTAVPAGESAAEWALFLSDISSSLDTLPLARGGIAPAHRPSSTCTTNFYPDGEAVRACRLSELHFAPTHFWRNKEYKSCPASGTHVPGGIYQDFQDVVANPFAGMNLGELANEPDDNYPPGAEKGDLALWIRLHMLGPLGTHILTGASSLAEVGLVLLIAGPVCASNFLQGDFDCWDDARRIADEANVIEDLPGYIPGACFYDRFCEIRNFLGIGMAQNFHFLHLQSPVSGEYNDVPGLHYDYAGPGGANGVLDLVFNALTDFGGYGIQVDESPGVRRYEIEGHETPAPNPSRHRSKAEWQGANFGHVELNPLDNLAEWGWSEFLKDTSTLRFLARPLHALGDASVPQHVLGTIGHGHAPFEAVLEKDWRSLLYQDPQNPARPYADAEKLVQLAQTRKILEEGFRWWKWVRSERALFPAEAPIPMRRWISAMAEETLVRAPPLLNDPASTVDIAHRISEKVIGGIHLQDAVDQSFAIANQAAAEAGIGVAVAPPDLTDFPNPYRQIMPLVRERVEASAGAKLAFLTLVGAEVATPIPVTTVTGCEALGAANCPASAPFNVGNECHPCPDGEVLASGVCATECAVLDQVSIDGVCADQCPVDRSIVTGILRECVAECRGITVVFTPEVGPQTCTLNPDVVPITNPWEVR